MLKAYRYRLYPTAEQAEYFAKSFGCCRIVYNRTLDYMSVFWIGGGRSVSYIDAKRQLVELKEMYPWLSEVNSQSLQYAVKQCADGFMNWWRRRAEHPQPKRKRGRQTFHNPQHCSVDWQAGTVSIPKCRNVRARLHRRFKGMVKDLTVIREPDGRYYVSVLVDTAEVPAAKRPVTPETTVGIDVGVHNFAVLSDGRVFSAGHFSAKASKRLAFYQRSLRRKTKGSRSWKRTQRRIADIHGHVARQRLDRAHKITYELTHDSQVGIICIEDLDIRQWMRNRHLAYDAADAAVGMFLNLLRYKCEWYGVNLLTIGRWDASSRTCSVCGAVNRSLKLGQHSWRCMSCGTVHDRDYNAAVNIRSFALRTLPSDGGKVTPADRTSVDDRRISGLRSRGGQRQESIRSATDAPVL